MENLFRYLPWRLLFSAAAFYSGYDGISLGIEKHSAATGLNAVAAIFMGMFWFLQPVVLSVRVFRAPLHAGMQLLSDQSKQAVIGPVWLRTTMVLSAVTCFLVGFGLRTIQFLWG